MAQWSHKDRTLYAKVVYYGPAFGGKTTNLESLHRITDPSGGEQLISIQTSDDRTIFFDLLPFDLGDILGYQVALKLYTVPGQVRYETTRQVVLSGADAVVFVADSSPGREEQNRWSLQNLRMNMRAKRLDPDRIPVIFQFNKQDLPEAARPDHVARWLRLPAGEGIPAIATQGEGVLETFVTACRTMLEHLVAHADERTRREIDVAELGRHVDRAFAAHRARQQTSGEPRAAERPLVLDGKDPLPSSVEASLELGERLAASDARATRLEREAETYRRLSDSLRSVGASFEPAAIVDSALEMIAGLLDVRAVSLLRRPTGAAPEAERVWGMPEDPLLAFPAGRGLAARMMDSHRACVVDDLRGECREAGDEAAGLRACAAVPIDSDPPRTLIVYAPDPDGRFERQDVRFLDTVAGHLAVGLEKAKLHAGMEQARERLEETVASRTEQLRRSCEELRKLEETKDRFLDNVSHEMKTPLTAILTSAAYLRDYNASAKERNEMLASIIRSGEALQRHLETLLRMVNLKADTGPLSYGDTTPGRLAEEALRLCGSSSPQVDVKAAPRKLRVDLPQLARAVAHLLENAVKFSPAETPVELRISKQARETVDISVLDRGPGVPEEDRRRVFGPFEQGGDPLTAKPNGIGIGLYEAEAIVRRHGGDIEYHPRQGGGSRFTITMPIRPPVAEPAQELAGA
jgi:signal transduction histidine kinase/signal recognition particle receptor subunit beta